MGQQVTTERLPVNDPRTLARDIPGILEALFPHLIPGVVAHFNRKSRPAAGCEPVPPEIIAASALQHAMLFEIAVAAAEQLMKQDGHLDWDICLSVAIRRQRRHFDARVPEFISEADKTAAYSTAKNLAVIMDELQLDAKGVELIPSPEIPGYQWIASGVGDFAVGTHLIEVKCTNRHFSSSDYRQIVMYWLLGYAASVESGAPEWSEGILVNPRLNFIVQLPFDEIIDVISAGKSKVELLELFSSMVGDRAAHSF